MSNADKLLELAGQKFPILSLAEEKVIRAAGEGGFADCRTPKDNDHDPAKADKWGADRVVRAEVIRWLCADTEARALVDPAGIRARCAKIENQLDLSWVDIPFPLCLDWCAISQDVQILDAALPLLSFQGSQTKSISAGRINVKGGVFLSEGFAAEGEVRFLGATIGGALDCTRGSFRNPKSKDDAQARALIADRIKVRGSVFLRERFVTEGEVRFPGATIGGNLDCTDGSFRNLKSKDGPDAKALTADGIDVKGNVFLAEGFAAVGEVRFVGAAVGGSLVCNGGTFRNPKSKDDPNAHALAADGINVKGAVFLQGPFAAEGRVSFVGATIGGHLDCTGGRFRNPKSNSHPPAYALAADRSVIKGGVFLHGGFAAEGEVRFTNATIGGDLDCHDAQLDNPSGHALRLGGAEVANRLILSDGFALAGKLSLTRVRAGQLWDDEESWPEKGKLHIHGFQYNSIHTGSPATAKQRLAWLRLQPTKPFRTQPYVQLARVLRESGNARGAREVLIAKEVDLRSYGDLTRFGKAWNWFLEKSIGYGYRTHLVLVWALLFLGLGANLFWAGDAFGLMVCVKGEPNPASMQPASKPPIQEPLRPPPGQSFYPAAYSLDALVPVVNLHQEEYWLPNPATHWGWWLRTYLWVHIGMGWFLTTLGILGLTGIVRR